MKLLSSTWNFYLRWPVIHCTRSRDIACCVLNRLRVVQPRNRVSNNGKGSNFIIFQSINTVSGTHPASYSVGTELSFTGNKSEAAVNRHLHLVPRLWMSDHILLHSSLSYGVYKDNFTLTLHGTIICNKFSNPNSHRDGIFYENVSFTPNSRFLLRFVVRETTRLVWRKSKPWSVASFTPTVPPVKRSQVTFFCSEYYQSFKIWELIFMNT
jgi:hypothetical protein